MIEEEVTVAALADGQVWVEKQPSGGCLGCANTCIGASVDPGKRNRSAGHLAVDCPFEVSVGDRIVIGVENGALFRGMVKVYLFPLAGLFGGAVAGQWLPWLTTGISADVGSAIGGLLGLLVTLAVVRRQGREGKPLSGLVALRKLA